MQSYPHNGSSPPEDTLNGEYSRLQHPENDEYSTLQHPGPHGNKSNDHPGGLVYAQVGNFSQSNKRALEASTASQFQDEKVQYSELTHKPAPPPELAAVDKLINLDSLPIQLRDAASQWYELGEQLGVSRDILNEIESYFPDVEGRRVEMFARYLEVQHYPTWSELARALRNVHQNELAEKLENIYVTGQLPIEVNMDAVPSSSYKYSREPPPPLPPKSMSGEFDFEASSPPPLVPPPKPMRQGSTPSSGMRAPPPLPQYDDTVVVPPRPPKSSDEPAQPPRPPKPTPSLPPKPKNL